MATYNCIENVLPRNPIFNEEKLIVELVRRTIAAIENVYGDYEVIFVDDGSTDNSMPLILNRGRRIKKSSYNTLQEFRHQQPILPVLNIPKAI